MKLLSVLKFSLFIAVICCANIHVLGQTVNYSLSEFSDPNKTYAVKTAQCTIFEKQLEYALKINYTESKNTVIGYLVLERISGDARQLILLDTLLEFDNFIVSDQEIFFDEVHLMNVDGDVEKEIVITFRYFSRLEDEKLQEDFAIVYDNFSNIIQDQTPSWIKKVILWENTSKVSVEKQILSAFAIEKH